jgi:hypothetical protein
MHIDLSQLGKRVFSGVRLLVGNTSSCIQHWVVPYVTEPVSIPYNLRLDNIQLLILASRSTHLLSASVVLFLLSF